MKLNFKNFFIAALGLAVVANAALANVPAVPFGEAAMWQMQQQAQQVQAAGGQMAASPRAAQNVPTRAGGTATPQGRAGGAGAAMQQQQAGRTGTAQPARAVTARSAVQQVGPVQQNIPQGAVSRAATPQGRVAGQQPMRAVPAGQQQARAVAQRPAMNNQQPGVAARTAQPQGRAVAARAGTVQPARISIQGANVMRRPTTGTGTGGQNLSNMMWTGNWQNLIDPNTGLLLGDAIAQCMEAYYACMDEICLARNPGQRRCACAARVVAYNQTIRDLDTAREELVRLSGELALIIAARGRDISAAFTMTEAEQALTCVAFRDAERSRTLGAWCDNNRATALNMGNNLAWDDAGDIRHCAPATAPPSGGTIAPAAPGFCEQVIGTNWLNTLDGSDSGILAVLEANARNLENFQIIRQDAGPNATFNASQQVLNALNNIGFGGSAAFGQQMTAATTDNLASMWGYDLFQFAHNNVCARVLDSCFNGIFEVAGYRGINDGQPGNLLSTINLNNSAANIGAIPSWERQTHLGTAAQFGYTVNNAVDPWRELRGPIADARRAIMMRYLLDANADCDLYGEELRRQVQNFSLQRIAATNMLQSSRLQFAQERAEEEAERFNNARNNFNACLSEITSCYRRVTNADPMANWQALCHVPNQIPACFREMVCHASPIGPQSVIYHVDDTMCDWNDRPCRNVVTISEILNGTAATAAVPTADPGSSMAFREWCLDQFNIEDIIRDWEPTPAGP